MASSAPSFPATPGFSPGALFRARPGWSAALVLLLAALVLRSAYFGLPLAGYDEGLYLLIGNGLLHGQLPYVEIWDRKPPGLFLFYAGFQLFGGNPALNYQLAATASIAATGWTIFAIVRRHFRDSTALVCGLLYVLYTGVMGGEAGQAPLFYNLPMAIAALLVLRAVPRIGTSIGFGEASLAMVLCGFALTIKTTAVFESGFFGLVVVLAALQAGYSLARLAGAVLLWAALGIAPFAIWAGIYWLSGHFDAFWFANVQSAMLRAGVLHQQKGWWQIALTAAAVGPLALLALAAVDMSLKAPRLPRWEGWMLAGWVAAALIGYASVGYYFHHYALPLLVPLAIAAARFVEGSHRRTLALALFSIYPLTQELVLSRLVLRNDRTQIAAIVDAIPPRVRSECMFIYGVPPILYQLTHACRVTRFAFSDHLFAADEAPAIGVDPLAATDAALRRRPAVIVTDWGSMPINPNWATLNRVRETLLAHYRLIGRYGYRSFEDTSHRMSIWERRD